jgi:hypothetical protein
VRQREPIIKPVLNVVRVKSMSRRIKVPALEDAARYALDKPKAEKQERPQPSLPRLRFLEKPLPPWDIPPTPKKAHVERRKLQDRA